VLDQNLLSQAVAVLPELSLLVVILAVLGADVLWPENAKRNLGLLAALGVGVTLLLTIAYASPAQGPSETVVLGGMLRHDMFAFVFRLMFLSAALLTCLISVDSPQVGRMGEYYAMLLVATIGMNLMAGANDLVMLYIALETSSISQYALAGMLRGDTRSAEAGIKYFLFGSASSAVMLFGLSLLYGLTGSTGFPQVFAALEAAATQPVQIAPLLAAIVLVLVGFGFKISAVPFHFWTPDVYEGAPAPVTAFISVASKAAGFSVLLRVFLTVFNVPLLYDKWWAMMWAIAAVTMTLGNLLALQQHNIKRLLAYSSIAQAGYVLIGFVAWNPANPIGAAASTYYLLAYALTNLAAFAVVILFANLTGSDEIKDYAGLSRRSPYLALAMMVALLSLGGMPPLGGFVAKFYVFLAALAPSAGALAPGVVDRSPWMVALVIIGILNAIIGLYYYLTVIKVMYVERSPEEGVKVPVPGAYRVALAVVIIGILAMGIYAGPWMEWSNRVAQALVAR
jgi:NADH-quinone oxidoreductase subunit N